MNCDWEKLEDKRLHCRRCGYSRITDSPHPIEKIDRPCRAWPRLWEWGFMLEVLLSAHGITTLFGPCNGCDSRKKSLNELGANILPPAPRGG